MGFSSASPFESVEAYMAAPPRRRRACPYPVPLLERFVIARGERATADLLTLNQVLVTCAEAIEAGSSNERPDLLGLVIAAKGKPASGAASNSVEGRNFKRVMLQATGDYLWKCTDNRGLLSLDDCAVFPSAMPPPTDPGTQQHCLSSRY